MPIFINYWKSSSKSTDPFRPPAIDLDALLFKVLPPLSSNMFPDASVYDLNIDDYLASL